MIMSLKVNYKCKSGGMYNHVSFYVMWYVWPCKLRWWASPHLLDLSHCTRVYVQGRRWVSSWSGLCLGWSDTYLQIPTKRSLDLSWLRCRVDLRRNVGTVLWWSNTNIWQTIMVRSMTYGRRKGSRCHILVWPYFRQGVDVTFWSDHTSVRRAPRNFFSEEANFYVGAQTVPFVH
jgi:hypothetical protein